MHAYVVLRMRKHLVHAYVVAEEAPGACLYVVAEEAPGACLCGS